jgi:hypothetical protein
MPTMIEGAQTTANVEALGAVRDVSRLKYLNPDIATFTHLLSEASAAVAGRTKFEWPEKDLAPRYDLVTGAQTAGDTTIEVDNPKYFKPGDIVKVPRTGETMRVTAIGAADITVIRSVGDTAAAALNDNEDLFRLGQAFQEGASLPVARDHQETWKHNFTEIFRWVVSETGTQASTRSYLAANNRTRLRMEAFKEHRISMEQAYLFGERSEDVSDTANPRRTTGGFEFFVTTNIKDASGTLSKAEIWDWCEDLFANTGGGNTRVVMHSALIGSVIDLLAEPSIRTVPKADAYGLSIRQWETSHGTLLLAKHRLFVDGATGDGYAGTAFALDPKFARQRFLEGRKSKLLLNRQAPGDDLWADEYLEESGLELSLESVHGILEGVTG